MNPMVLLLFANGLVDLALKIYGGIKDDPASPEEARARADVAFTNLSGTKQAIEAYQPVPPGG